MSAELEALFTAYARAFDAVDAESIADAYHVPCLTLRADGSIHALTDRGAVERFFRDVAAGYRDEGNRRCAWSGLEVRPLGEGTLLVTMDWQLRREDGSALRGWRQTYQLVRRDGRWKILVSTFHVR